MGFKKGHPPYNNKLEEWRKNGGVPWNKGIKGKDSHSFGRKFSLERRKKISLKLKKNENSLGYCHSKEAKEKIRKAHIGMKRSEETNKKISGKNHWKWIKDRNLVKKNERNDGAYLQWVKKVKKRDKNSCALKSQECSGYNIVHHIYQWSLYPKLRYIINNGITLCQFHHPRKREDEQRLRPILKRLVIGQEG